MKFVDEAVISVHAGNGGHGCLSFLREKFRPNGGPDGGDGGRGGSVYLVPNVELNTLADFRFTRKFKAKTGVGGAGRNRFGKAGDDRLIEMPSATVVTDYETGEVIVDLSTQTEPFLIAEGGRGGLGNARFKSSTNQSPRRITEGTEGDERVIKLELRVLADVGMLGLPNAGKSTFLRSVSHARPKVADYPFTTLHPQLGVVDMAQGEGFVVADIPGLIEGASAGAGLGIRFLKHLRRTRLLIHLVDLSGVDPELDPIRDIKTIIGELTEFGHELDQKPRWLVFNKCDIPGMEHCREIGEEIIKAVEWNGPVYWISAIKKEGLKPLCFDIFEWLKEQAVEE
ncbi:MAG: GTP-binding protein [Parasphingorhabdus sp.]|jgi:GTP-binding protein